MSRSYRSPFAAVTGARSAADDKRLAARGVRRKQNQWLRKRVDFDDAIVPHRLECPWNEVYCWGEMATSVFRSRTIEIGLGIVFIRTVFIHTNRLNGETATNGRRVGMCGCSASKDLGRRTTWGGRLLCKQDSQVGSIPTRSTKFRQSRMRGRYAPLKTERAAFNSLGWHHGE
jgi:hypothetical protein